jgi:hypothetical protein
MIKADYLLLASLSIIWRLLNVTTIARFHAARYATDAENKVWRSCTWGSTVKAHMVTWSIWLLTAFYFASTVSVRPTSTWVVVAAPAILAALTLVVFLQYTARGTAIKAQDLFLGSPIMPRLPSASNLLIAVGILADLSLLVLRLGWLR